MREEELRGDKDSPQCRGITVRLRIIERINLPHGPKAALEIVDDRPREERVRSICPYPRAPVDVMVYRRCVIAIVREVGFLM